MAEATLKRHDTWPPLTATLTQTNPTTGVVEPIDLTTALKVTLWFKFGSTVIEAVTTVTDAKNGVLSYSFKKGATPPEDETATSGEYKVEAEIEWSSTKIQTVPSASYGTMLIVDDLPNA